VSDWRVERLSDLGQVLLDFDILFCVVASLAARFVLDD